MKVVLIYTVIITVYSQTIELQRNTSSSEQMVLDYRDKICRSEKTCHLIGTVNSSLQTMKERNCMCDESCALYGDCCEDSGYINDSKMNKTEYFHCPSAERVYMKTSCPANYPNRSVKSKCESSTKSLQDENKKLYIPVTNVQKNITYGNEYCAVCNNEFVYKAWSLNTHCTPLAHKDRITASATKTVADAAAAGEFVDYYSLNVEEAKKRVQFDSNGKIFFSEYNGTRYDCWYSRQKPTTLEPHFRDCVSAISNCGSLKNGTSADLCETSRTSIVYDESNVAYKNEYCAYCNNVTGSLRGCLDAGLRITGSSIFTTFDKTSAQRPPCRDADDKIKKKFC